MESNEDDRHAAAVIFLDGVLGEVRRLRLIREVEVVTALSEEQAAKASKAEHLAAHLARLSG